MPVELLRHNLAVDAIMSTYEPELHSGIMRLHKERQLVGVFQAIFPEAQHLNRQYLEDLLDRRLADHDLIASSRISQDIYRGPTTRLSYELTPHHIPSQVKEAISRLRILAVGGGLGNLVKLAALHDMSYVGLDLETIDPLGRFGGQWVKDPEGLGVTYNNPALSLLNADLTDTTHRDNIRMQNFINPLSRRFNRQQPIKGTVAKLRKRPLGRTAMLDNGHDATPGRTSELTFLALGNYPMPIESSKIRTNAKYFESEISRNQRPISEDEARSLDNKSVLIVGLGNSALRQVEFIKQANLKYNVNISPIILTHFTSEGLWNPDEYHLRADGSLDRVSRDLPHGKTTNLELDLEESNRLYHWLLYSSTLMDSTLQAGETRISGIVPSVTEYYLNTSNDGYEATVRISDDHEKGINGTHIIKNIGAIFVLAGYGVPSEMLNNMEVMSRAVGRAEVKPHIGSAYLIDGSHDPTLIVGGIAATSDRDPSINTLPGMLAQLPNVLFHSALYAMSN